jgi:penicillin-binding protein-related factor A (putative recombinase)
MLEAAFSTKVLKKLRAEIGGSWRKNPVSKFGSSGIGDIVGCVKGRYVEIELKAPGKYRHPLVGCSDLQLAHGKEVMDNGGVWICEDNLNELLELLSQALHL